MSQTMTRTRTRPTPRQLHDLRTIGYPAVDTVLTYHAAEVLIDDYRARNPDWVGTATPAMLDLLADLGRPMDADTAFEVARATIDGIKAQDPASFEQRRAEAAARRSDAAPGEDHVPQGKLGEYVQAARTRYETDPDREPASARQIKYAMDLAFDRPSGDALRIEVFSDLKKGASAGKVNVLLKKLTGEFVERRAA